MAILKIYTFPDPVLRVKAQPVTDFGPELVRLTQDMLDTMYDAPGVGLAAPQIGVSQRVVVLDCTYSITPSELDPQLPVYQNQKPLVLINPVIGEGRGETSIEEGCLSVPGYTERVSRKQTITVTYQTVDGQSAELETQDFLAVAIQHEIDHLNGLLFIDRLSLVKRNMAKSKIRKERSKKFERSKFHVEL